jgi:hypothetical protein
MSLRRSPRALLFFDIAEAIALYMRRVWLFAEKASKTGKASDSGKSAECSPGPGFVRSYSGAAPGLPIACGAGQALGGLGG